MNVEQRCVGVPVTPEVRALVRTVFERALAPVEESVAWVRVRVAAEGEDIVCRAHLCPSAGGAALVVTAKRSSTFEAVLAGASGLARALDPESRTRGRSARGRSARERAARERRARKGA